MEAGYKNLLKAIVDKLGYKHYKPIAYPDELIGPNVSIELGCTKIGDHWLPSGGIEICYLIDECILTVDSLLDVTSWKYDRFELALNNGWLKPDYIIETPHCILLSDIEMFPKISQSVRWFSWWLGSDVPEISESPWWSSSNRPCC